MTVTTERPKKAGALKLGFATVAAAALAFGGVAPAYAADIQLGPDDIIGFENGAEGTDGYNYDQWHVANTENPEATVDQSLQFGECSVTTLAAIERDVTQVLKGFPIDARPTAGPEGTVDELRTLINSISIDVAEGNVTLQIPVFAYLDGDTEETPYFTTFRNANTFGPGVHSLQGVEITSSDGGDINSDFDELLQWMQEDIDEYGDVIQILGVGFSGSEGAEINSISFAGDTYFFGTGDCTPDQGGEDDDDQGGSDDEDGPDTPRKPERIETGL